jgi:NADPH-dependent F420 reductase
MKIAILGGTGAEGSGLGFRWAAAGHEVIIGSRKRERGEEGASELNGLLENAGKIPNVIGTDNLEAAKQGEIVVLSVPYWAQEDTLAGLTAQLAGKILVTVVVPMGEKAARVHKLPSGMSGAEEAQTQLGEDTRVVAAFQNISAHHLMDLDHDLDCDVLICGTKKADKDEVAQLCADAGMRGVNAGGLENASVIEGMTNVLIGINIRHKIKNAGIRITGI